MATRRPLRWSAAEEIVGFTLYLPSFSYRSRRGPLPRRHGRFGVSDTNAVAVPDEPTRRTIIIGEIAPIESYVEDQDERLPALTTIITKEIC